MVIGTKSRAQLPSLIFCTSWSANFSCHFGTLLGTSDNSSEWGPAAKLFRNSTSRVLVRSSWLAIAPSQIIRSHPTAHEIFRNLGYARLGSEEVPSRTPFGFDTVRKHRSDSKRVSSQTISKPMDRGGRLWPPIKGGSPTQLATNP
jgi:hypothetical protein